VKANPQLHQFILPYDAHVQEIAIALRGFITDLVPEANELIWDNYNAVAIAYSKSEMLKDAFCHIAVYAKHVNFGFNRGAALTYVPIKLNGSGKLIRHISIKDLKDFPTEEIKGMISEAINISERLNPKLTDKKDDGMSLVMSISEKKIRPKK